MSERAEITVAREGEFSRDFKIEIVSYFSLTAVRLDVSSFDPLDLNLDFGIVYQRSKQNKRHGFSYKNIKIYGSLSLFMFFVCLEI